MKVQVSMEGILRTSVKNNQAQIFEINNSDPCYMEKNIGCGILQDKIKLM